MSIKVPLKQKTPQIEIDLRGEKGNVFYLISLGCKLASQLDMDWNTIQRRMTSRDYIQAVKIFDAYFGHYVTMYVSETLREQLTK